MCIRDRVYTYEELKSLSETCKANDLILYCDGARLGTVLCQEKFGVTLEALYNLTDAFFIGATKNGALLGEALVIRSKSLQTDIKYHIKQRGGLLAKGRLLGTQFETLFTDNLYTDLAKHSIDMAKKLQAGLREAGITFLVEPQTNQLFPVLKHDLIEKLHKKFDFYVWKPISEDRSAIRLITSWATKENAVDDFIKELK